MCDVCGESSPANIGVSVWLSQKVNIVLCSKCMKELQERLKDKKDRKTGICTFCGEVQVGISIKLTTGEEVHCCMYCIESSIYNFDMALTDYRNLYKEAVLGYLDSTTEQEMSKYTAMLPLPRSNRDASKRTLKYLLDVGTLNGLFEKADTFSGYKRKSDSLVGLNAYTVEDLLDGRPTGYDYWLTSNIYAELDSVHIDSLEKLIHKKIDVEFSKLVEQVYRGMSELDLVKVYPHECAYLRQLATYSVLFYEYGRHKYLMDMVDEIGTLPYGYAYMKDYVVKLGFEKSDGDMANDVIGYLEDAISYLHTAILKCTSHQDYMSYAKYVIGNTEAKAHSDIDIIQYVVGRLLTNLNTEKLLIDRIANNNLKGFYALLLKYCHRNEKVGERYSEDPFYTAFAVSEIIETLTPEIKEELMQICDKASIDEGYILDKYPMLDPKSWILKLMSPHTINAKLSESIIGQERAKKIVSVGVYNHMKRLHLKLKGKKSNIMLIGATGVGKTEIVRTIANILDVPVCICDATSMTQAGYVGEDVESCVARLLAVCDGNVAQAERGIIYIDEIDKISRSGGADRGVSSECVQQSLLKIIEGCEVEVKKSNHPLDKQSVKVNTDNILFICGGAFEDITMKKNKEKVLGFNSVPKDDNKRVTQERLTKCGMIPEFIGRFPVLAELHELSVEDLKRILTEPKNSLLYEYTSLIKADGVDLEITDKALTYIAEQAKDKGTGARGLKSVIEDYMIDIMYDIPSKEGIETVTIDANEEGLLSRGL